ncbi:gamma-interferon-inducible lysosomal thiol reductase-like [Quillaja saponaria]|uniref:Gamma-interferon-inducible lysosomal thiol reductase-like n=1 Tax=Quillaja saponaria TaxID=32244 RepID=A0AAD7L223_QUISA|nr:gamma-interferon-inducible lysosomal thiol reductase-like [Quillaja saponaria]
MGSWPCAINLVSGSSGIVNCKQIKMAISSSLSLQFFSYFVILLFFLLSVSVSPSYSFTSSNSNELVDEKVTVSLYYETLCPFCADFIANQLVKIFQNGLFNVVNLRMIPWGNAWIQPNGSVVCQHGPDECFLNTIEACTITTYPDVVRHFRFIHCVESLTLERRPNEWASCFQKARLGTAPIDCYKNGYGKAIEQKYGRETLQLNPSHRFVPWVIVNNHPLQEDYQNFMSYICGAYKGNHKPDACRSLSTNSTTDSNEKANSVLPVCYTGEARETSFTLPPA